MSSLGWNEIGDIGNDVEKRCPECNNLMYREKCDNPACKDYYIGKYMHRARKRISYLSAELKEALDSEVNRLLTWKYNWFVRNTKLINKINAQVRPESEERE